MHASSVSNCFSNSMRFCGYFDIPIFYILCSLESTAYPGISYQLFSQSKPENYSTKLGFLMHDMPQGNPGSLGHEADFIIEGARNMMSKSW